MHSSFESKQKKTKISHNYLRMADLDHVLDAAVGMFLNHRLNPDQRFDLVVKKTHHSSEFYSDRFTKMLLSHKTTLNM